MATSPRTGRILQIIKIVIWAVIAIALVKFAFFPSVGGKDATQSLDPSANFGPMTVTPTRADITNTVTASGTIEADPASDVKSTGEGTVTYIAVADGSSIESGAPILEVRKEIPGENQTGVDAEGNPTVTPGETTYQYTTIYANATGTLHLNALLGQQFSIGDVVATIQPPTFSAVAALNADQLYRIQEAPQEATITVTNGPAPFTCTGLKIKTPTATPGNAAKSDASNSAGGASSSGIRAICPIPGDQKVFPGLQVTMDVIAGSAQGVLTLPISAVEGRFQSGYVYVPSPEGADPAKKPVKLGITDGKIVEIVEGIGEKDEVLEFVPSAKPDEKQMGGFGGGMAPEGA